MSSSLLRSARAALAEGNPHDALTLLERALEVGDAPEVRLLQAHAYELCGEFDLALAAYTTAAELDAQTAVPLVRQGVLLRELGRVEAAHEAFEAALRRAPTDLEAVGECALTWMQLGHETKAEEIWQRVTESSADPSALQRARGRMFGALDRHEDARVCFARAVDLSPASPEAHLDLASVSARLGRYEDALPSYDVVLASARDDDERISIMMCQAICHAESGRFEDASMVLERVLALQPAHARAALELGVVRERAGDYLEAIDWYDQAAIAGEAARDEAEARGGASPMHERTAAAALLAKIKLAFLHADDEAAGLDAIDALAALVGPSALRPIRELADELERAGRDEAATSIREECDEVERLI